MDLLERVLEFWENDPPDMVVGWNSEGFDIPYIINRLIKLFGEDYAKRLSPVQNIYQRECWHK
jgi:DNA polymerase elongation subunit (family B)